MVVRPDFALEGSSLVELLFLIASNHFIVYCTHKQCCNRPVSHQGWWQR